MSWRGYGPWPDFRCSVVAGLGCSVTAMIIAGYRGPESWAKTLADEGDAGSIADSVTAERSLLHVAATRAKRFLTVCELRS